MSGSASMRLTEEQAAIVAHDRGPALVYAVAGAGKTTAMVERIGRLVGTGVFRAEEILATSFNRDANRQIRAALQRWPACAGVEVRTLHALGYQIVSLAARRGLVTSGGDRARAGAPEKDAAALLKETLAEARRLNLAYVDELDRLDWDDFLAYVGVCKAHLAYADLRAARLPRRSRRVASQAAAPPGQDWYLDLYRLFEIQRRRAAILTFDDMLMSAWEILVRYPAVLDSMQERYQCVIVDEFQDVNLAQVELLDLLTASHRNYMAIGDDDQTIYQWRGADPAHFRRFRRRYRARVYTMTENFRCTASQVALANQVIQHNRDRQPKALGLTQGFGGESTVSESPDENVMALRICDEIRDAQATGYRTGDIAILVRLYAQVPILEDALRAAGIDYRVDGEMPSYLRRSDTATPVGGTASSGRSVTITTIYRAKGLEWPVVIVPHCNQGIMPAERAIHPAEERRLFYVALTRAQERLHLHTLIDRPVSQYLLESDYPAVLNSVRAVRHALVVDPAQWGMPEFLAVGVNLRRLQLHTYFVRWWQVPQSYRRQVATAILGFYAALRQRRLFKKLGLQGEDIRLWQAIAGQRLRVAPLNRPDLEEFFRQLR